MLGQLCGSLILTQPRKALSRHSSSHSGSPFLAEIKRIMSSFSPLGAASASMSVTKPYLYSLLTSVSTDELIRFPLTIVRQRPHPRVRLSLLPDSPEAPRIGFDIRRRCTRPGYDPCDRPLHQHTG